MAYNLHWSKKSEKFLEKLPREISHRIVHKVNSIKDDPFHFVEHYEGEDYFKLRIGKNTKLLPINNVLIHFSQFCRQEFPSMYY